MNNRSKLQVYYNSACPVCKAEIEGQKLKDRVCEIQWKDVHQENGFATEVDSELEFIRERLHVVDEHGVLQIGLDAFLAIWRNSPTETWKAKLLGLPLIKPLCQVAYNLFAAVLYRWNKAMHHW